MYYINLLQIKHRSFSASESGDFDLSKYEQMIKKALHPNSTIQNKIVNGQMNAKLSGGGGNRQVYSGVGGYVDDYQNIGGTKHQLLNLIRSVRTVMRVPLIAFNIIMSTVASESSLNLEKDIERAIVFLDRLRTTSEIPETKLLELQCILQSDFFHAVLEVYEKIYETVQVTGSPAVAAFAASEGHSHPRIIELPKTQEGLGFNVMGGREQNSTIFISRIISNVNGVSVENEYHEEAVELLKQAQNTVKLVVRYSPQVLIEMENRFEKQRTARRQRSTSTTPVDK
ncbi:unnamed protein product [Rotaria sp. Silwood1]|nr:unnamed protein product [Rotaria sp. Silwood1]